MALGQSEDVRMMNNGLHVTTYAFQVDLWPGPNRNR